MAWRMTEIQLRHWVISFWGNTRKQRRSQLCRIPWHWRLQLWLASWLVENLCTYVKWTVLMMVHYFILDLEHLECDNIIFSNIFPLLTFLINAYGSPCSPHGCVWFISNVTGLLLWYLLQSIYGDIPYCVLLGKIVHSDPTISVNSIQN